MDLGALVGLVTASVLGRVANRTFRFIFRSDQVLDGFPRWRWFLSFFTQAAIFPMFILLSWLHSAQSYGLDEWLMASAAKLSGVERWYVYALFASQTRDMFPMPAKASFMMKLHHWVVVIACILSLCAPQGFGLFVLGTFVLELGSMTFNLRVLYPGSTAVAWTYQTCMLASNVAALAGGALMVCMPGIPVWMKMLYFAADVGVCLGRQRHALKDAGLLGRHRAMAKASGTIPAASAASTHAVATSAASPTAAAAAGRGRGKWYSSGVPVPAAGRFALRKWVMGLELLAGYRWFWTRGQAAMPHVPHLEAAPALSAHVALWRQPRVSFAAVASVPTIAVPSL